VKSYFCAAASDNLDVNKKIVVLTVDVDGEPFADRGRDTVVGDAQVVAHVRARHVGQQQDFARDISHDWNKARQTHNKCHKSPASRQDTSIARVLTARCSKQAFCSCSSHSPLIGNSSGLILYIAFHDKKSYRPRV